MKEQTFIQESLTALGFESLNAIQQAYLSLNAANQVLLAPTGSGKTLAYLLRLRQLLEEGSVKGAWVICPTRELAIQIHGVWKKMNTGMLAVMCYGGHEFKLERQQLEANPVLVIATPGRLLDHLNRATQGLPVLQGLILDEYDKMLELGFLDQINELLSDQHKLSHIQCISATAIEQWPSELERFDFETCDVREAQPELYYYSVKADGNDKLKALALLLQTLANRQVVVFFNHREATERIASHLQEFGIKSAVFHGGLSQQEREMALIRFQFREFNILISSDLAARGLDFDGIDLIVHYQYPNHLHEFVHRNGRSARNGGEGHIYLLHSAEEPLPGYLSEMQVEPVQLTEEWTDYPESGICTIHINGGRKHKIRKTDILGALTAAGIAGSQVGEILVQDRQSFVALNEIAFSKVKEQLKRIRIKKENFALRRCW